MKSTLGPVIVAAALAGLVGCGESASDAAGGADLPPMMTAPDAALDAGPAPEPPAIPDAGWLAADELGPCEAPAELGTEPLVETAVLDLIPATGIRPLHVTDIQRDPQRDRFFTVGAGGLFVVDYAADQLSVVGTTAGDGRAGRSFSKVEPLGNGRVLVTSRNRGFSVYDVADEGTLTLRGTLDIDDASGMAFADPYAYVLAHTGRLHTVDLSTPDAPRTVHTLEGLGNPWEITLHGQRAYVADNSLGLVVVDLTTPAAPALGAAIAAAGSAQDVDIDGDHLFLAVGAAGVETFSLVDPDVPTAVSIIDFGASVVSVSASEGLVWGANQDAVAVAEAMDPANPVPLGIEPTDEWAMHVHAEGSRAFVADWGQLSVLELDRAQPAPAVSVNRQEVLVVAGTDATRLTLTNRGGAPLEVSGLGVDDARFTATLEKTVLTPGESAGIDLRFDEDGADISASLCVATNDPGTPVLQVGVSSSQSGAEVGIGEMAPDFVLRDIDGNSHQLSSQRGQPVVLAYFATW